MVDISIYFGSVDAIDTSYENVNQTFDVRSAQWNEDGTKVVDADGEYIEAQFLYQMAANPETPGAALALAIANLRLPQEDTGMPTIGLDEDFNADEQQAIIEELTKIGMQTGILDEEGVHSPRAQSWIRALAEALGRHADDLTREVEGLTKEIAGLKKDADGNYDNPSKLSDLQAVTEEFKLFMGVIDKSLESAGSVKQLVQ